MVKEAILKGKVIVTSDPNSITEPPPSTSHRNLITILPATFEFSSSIDVMRAYKIYSAIPA